MALSDTTTTTTSPGGDTIAVMPAINRINGTDPRSTRGSQMRDLKATGPLAP